MYDCGWLMKEGLIVLSPWGVGGWGAALVGFHQWVAAVTIMDLASVAQ